MFKKSFKNAWHGLLATRETIYVASTAHDMKHSVLKVLLCCFSSTQHCYLAPHSDVSAEMGALEPPLLRLLSRAAS